MTTTANRIDGVSLDVLLRDGAIATVRSLRASDEDALRALNDRVSVRTRYRRFFSASDRPGQWYVGQLLQSIPGAGTLVATVRGELVAVAGFARSETDPRAAELALLIDDAHQSEGLGGQLLEHLAAAARHQGIGTFLADVLTENTSMLHLLRTSGFRLECSSSRGITAARVDLTEGPLLWDAVRARDNASQRISLGPVLAPGSVAVVGSVRAGSVADHVRDALEGFTGTVVSGEAGVPLVDAVDLVIVVVPAAHVLTVARDAAAVGAKGLLVLSAGFAEEGAEGRARQEELVELCRLSGMRLIGPNCLGIVNTDPDVRLNATFCDAQPRAGTVALLSQSGAVGIAALRHAERAGVGLSLFVSTGNKADVSGNDLLAYVQDDPRTEVVGMYLESFGNARKFARVAAELGRTKPIVVLKAGATAAGAKAGQSHTAAAATPAIALEAIFHEAGVVRAADLPEMFDLLGVLASSPLPKGNRVAVIGNSGGPGVLAADASQEAGLVMAELSAGTQAALRALLPSSAAVTNPVDLLATVRPEAYAQALQVVLADEGVDAVVAIYTPISAGSESPYASAIADAAGAQDRPVLAVFPGVGSAPPALLDAGGGLTLPFFEFAEPAVRALGKVTAYAAWRAQIPLPAAEVVDLDRRDRALALLDSQEGWLSPMTTTALLEAYDIPTAPVIEAYGADSVCAAAEALGYPVALKAVGSTIVHKSDVGGVALGLVDARAVAEAYAAMAERVGEAMTSAVVQSMHPSSGGLELIVGVTVDANVGSVVLVGEGGTYTALLDDRVVRLPAESRQAAWDQLGGLRCAPRFGGYRGAPALDAEAVVDVLMALSSLVRELPQVRELDLNPLLVTASGACALDARVRIGPPVAPLERGTRSLSPAHRAG